MTWPHLGKARRTREVAQSNQENQIGTRQRVVNIVDKEDGG